MTYQDQDIEFRSPEEIRDFQDGRLRVAIRYLAECSPFYQRMFRDCGIDPARIRTIDDLSLLPFTEKKDLQLHNSNFLCVPPHKVIDYITTSGTLGDPVTFGCTDSDLERLALNEKKSFECAGVRPGDIVQLMTTLDKRFMAGLAYFLGIRKLGASVIRVGNGMPELQWDTISRLRPDTLMCVPSFILRLIDYAEQHGIDYRASSVRRIIGIGEGLREQDFSLNLLGSRIREKWDVELFATYSSTEMGATFSECPCGCGGHVHPELIIVEIRSEEHTSELQSRTGDMSSRITGQCGCGRWSYRLTPLVGRKNNMIKLKGTTIYPPAINDVLDNTPYVVNYVVEVRNSFAGTDEVVVRVGVASQQPFDVIKDLKDRFRSRIRVAPIVEVLSPDDVYRINNPSDNRKPIKFIDNRHKK